MNGMLQYRVGGVRHQNVNSIESGVRAMFFGDWNWIIQ